MEPKRDSSRATEANMRSKRAKRGRKYYYLLGNDSQLTGDSQITAVHTFTESRPVESSIYMCMASSM